MDLIHESFRSFTLFQYIHFYLLIIKVRPHRLLLPNCQFVIHLFLSVRPLFFLQVFPFGGDLVNICISLFVTAPEAVIDERSQSSKTGRDSASDVKKKKRKNSVRSEVESGKKKREKNEKSRFC